MGRMGGSGTGGVHPPDDGLMSVVHPYLKSLRSLKKVRNQNRSRWLV